MKQYLITDRIIRDKSVVLGTFNAEIKALNTHIKYLKMIYNVLPKYEGKILNKNFINFLTKNIEFKEINVPSIEWDSNIKEGGEFKGGEIIGVKFTMCLRVIERSFDYTVTNKFQSYQACKYIINDQYFTHLIASKENRLKSKESQAEITKSIERINKVIENYKDAISNIDAYIQANIEIENAIAAYEEKINNLLRLRISIQLPF